MDDALKLEKEGKVVLRKDHFLEWTCTKNESFFSSELNELNRKTVFFEKKLNEIEVNAVKEKGIAFSLFLDSDPEFSFFSELMNSCKFLFSSFPLHVSSLSSAFFDESFSNSVLCVFSSVLSKFTAFSSKNYSLSFVSKNKVLLDSVNPLGLLRDFSENERIPVPELQFKN